MSWKKDIGYFERTPNMVFALERRTVNGKTKNYPVIRNKMKELIQYIARHREELEKTLSDEQKKIFEKFDDCNSELNRLSETSIFECGFEFGARLILSVLIE